MLHLHSKYSTSDNQLLLNNVTCIFFMFSLVCHMLWALATPSITDRDIINFVVHAIWYRNPAIRGCIKQAWCWLPHNTENRGSNERGAAKTWSKSQNFYQLHLVGLRDIRNTETACLSACLFTVAILAWIEWPPAPVFMHISIRSMPQWSPHTKLSCKSIKHRQRVLAWGCVYCAVHTDKGLWDGLPPSTACPLGSLAFSATVRWSTSCSPALSSLMHRSAGKTSAHGRRTRLHAPLSPPIEWSVGDELLCIAYPSTTSAWVLDFGGPKCEQ